MGERSGVGGDVAIFLLLTLIWGTTWAAIRVALVGIPPLTGVAIRFALAGVLLLALALARGVRLGATRREVRLWWFNAATTFAGSYGLVYWAEQWVPSGLAAVLFATFPIWAVVLGRWFLPGERIDGRRSLALVAGLAGVALLFSEDFARLGGTEVRRASLLLLVAPAASAAGSLAVKRWGQGVSPLSLTAVPMLMTGAGVGLAAAIAERGREIGTAPAPWLATLYLALAGSALTFTLYFRLLARRSMLAVSLISYTVPLVAVLVGVIALGEPFTLRLGLGTLMILGGVGFAVAPRRKLAAPPP